MEILIRGSVKIIPQIFTFFFSSTCFVLAGYMVLQQFREYFSNQDFTIISRHTFDGEKDNRYPAISICLYGRDGKIFQRLFNKTSLATRLPICKSCLNGKDSCMANETSEMACGPEEIFLAMSGKQENNNISSFPFELLTYDALSMVLDHKSRAKGAKTSKAHSTLPNGIVSGVTKTYHDPMHVCLSKTRKFESKRLLTYQYWEISTLEMLSSRGNYDIRIFVHQKGQLLRSLGAPTFVLDNEFLKNKKERLGDGLIYKIDLDINSVHVLQKRHDSSQPCDEMLLDEDSIWIRNAIRLLNCTPVFWEKTKSRLRYDRSDTQKVSCSKAQLLEFYSKYSPKSNFENITKYYVQPCTEMESIVTSLAKSMVAAKNSSGGLGSHRSRLPRLEIMLFYKSRYYSLATNEKAFTLLALWSQIGGFVGIFLGYSLLQLPELIGYIVTLAKKFQEYLSIHRNRQTNSDV